MTTKRSELSCPDLYNTSLIIYILTQVPRRKISFFLRRPIFVYWSVLSLVKIQKIELENFIQRFFQLLWADIVHLTSINQEVFQVWNTLSLIQLEQYPSVNIGESFWTNFYNFLNHWYFDFHKELLRIIYK